MKNISTFLISSFMLFNFIKSNGQSNATTLGLNEKDFNVIVNNQFSSLVNGQAQNSVGNFASLDLQNSEVLFSGNAITKTGNIFGLNASGGINDGVLSIFKNSKFNTKASLEGHANFLRLKNKQLSYTNESLSTFNTKKLELDRKYDTLKIAVEHNKNLNALKLKKTKLEDQVNDLSKLNPKKIETLDSIKYLIAIKTGEILKLDSIIKTYPDKDILIEGFDNLKSIDLKKLKPDLEIEGFHLKWFSIRYKISRNEFKLFNPAVSFENQLIDSNFVSHEFKFQYNNYLSSTTTNESFFYCFGVSISIKDNLSDLQKTEINETKSYNNVGFNRYSAIKYTAFAGDYQRNLQQIMIYGDYYKFISKSRQFAIHLFSEYQFRNKSVPIFNSGLGLLMSFKSKKDEKAILNTELFYNMIDITKNTSTTLRLFERNTIGIRFTFPVSFTK